MQVWHDITTMEVKAVYSDKYNGTSWADQGFVLYERDGPLDRRFMPGAIISIVGDVIELVTPEPPPVIPPPTADELRLAELHVKLGDDTINDRELTEMLRLERGL